MDGFLNWIGNNKEWFFSGAGLFIIGMVLNHFKNETKCLSIKQSNCFFSRGEQIGIQNNYYKENENDRHDK